MYVYIYIWETKVYLAVDVCIGVSCVCGLSLSLRLALCMYTRCSSSRCVRIRAPSVCIPALCLPCTFLLPLFSVMHLSGALSLCLSLFRLRAHGCPSPVANVARRSGAEYGFEQMHARVHQMHKTCDKTQR